MAILKGGINGPFSGKVGSIVGYELNGQAIIRSLPKVVKRAPSELTLINRMRMKVVSQFLRHLKAPIAFGYKNVAPKGSRIGTFQSAQSYLFHNAIDYDAENVPYVNPEKVLVFRGDMVPPLLINVERRDNKLYVEWNKDACKGYPAAVVVLAYIIEKSCAWNEGAAISTDGKMLWEHAQFSIKEDQVHIYVGFYDMLHDKFSDSVYGGCV